MSHCYKCDNRGIIYERDPYGDCVNLEACDCKAAEEKFGGSLDDEDN